MERVKRKSFIVDDDKFSDDEEFDPDEKEEKAQFEDSASEEEDGYEKDVQYKPMKENGLVKKVIKYYSIPQVKRTTE